MHILYAQKPGHVLHRYHDRLNIHRKPQLIHQPGFAVDVKAAMYSTVIMTALTSTANPG